MQKKTLLILTTLILVGGILRFYNLNWDGPYFFHPDERNIAASISQLRFPDQLNPHFFAYGAFPIYLVYFLGVVLNLLQGVPLEQVWSVRFENAVLIGRVISALLSTLTIPLVYFLMRSFAPRRGEISANAARSRKSEVSPRNSRNWLPELLSLFAAALVTFTPGLIQYAHFSTFEIILTLEYLLITYFCLKILGSSSWRNYLPASLLIGFALATKMTSLVALVPLFISHFFACQNCYHETNHGNSFVAIILSILKALPHFINKKLVFSLALAGLAFALSSPYNLLDFENFTKSMHYEGTVATGKLSVFYTAQFINTTPFLYQLKHVFPYILGWPLTILGMGGLGYLLIGGSGQGDRKRWLVFSALPLAYLAFHTALYVKWVRYMVPVVPYLIIAGVVLLTKLRISRLPVYLTKQTTLAASTVLLVTQVFFGLAFMNIYRQKDTRLAAAEWAGQNISSDSQVLSEVYDLGILPFNDALSTEQIKLFNFYDLEKPPSNSRIIELNSLIKNSDYIILPSQRIAKTRLQQPELFPDATDFYQKLFEGLLGFKKSAEFQTYPEVFGVRWDDVGAEETFRVFDHPKVMIFKKKKGW